MAERVSLLDRLRDRIGAVAWEIFLWANRITAEQYWQSIYDTEKSRRS